MLPGWCCIANRHIGARERRQLIPHVRFQVPFLGPESQLKSGFACAGLLCKTGLQRRHRIQPAEGPVLDPRAKETCFKKGQKVDPLEIKSGSPWRVQFLLRRYFKLKVI